MARLAHQRANMSISPLKIIETQPELSEFELFWECYPKKKKKGDAFKAWKQTVELRPPIEKIVAALNEQCKSDNWNEDGGRWVPLPATWLRAWQWDDE